MNDLRIELLERVWSARKTWSWCEKDCAGFEKRVEVRIENNFDDFDFESICLFYCPTKPNCINGYELDNRDCSIFINSQTCYECWSKNYPAKRKGCWDNKVCLLKWIHPKNCTSMCTVNRCKYDLYNHFDLRQYYKPQGRKQE